MIEANPYTKEGLGYLGTCARLLQMAVSNHQTFKPAIDTRLYQTCVLMIALIAGFVFVHWLTVRPALDIQGQADTVLVSNIFRHIFFRTSFGNLTSMLLGVIAVSGLLTLALAAALAVRVPEYKVVRNLALSFALGPLSISYFFFVNLHPVYRSNLNLLSGSWTGTFVDCLAYFAFLISVFLFIRFSADYPRSMTMQQMIRADRVTENRNIKKNGGTAKARQRRKNFQLGWKTLQAIRHPLAFYVLAVAAGAICIADRFFSMSAAQDTLLQQFSLLPLGFVLLICVKVGMLVQPIGVLVVTFVAHSKSSFADDRKKMEWITAAFLVCAILFVAILNLSVLTFLLFHAMKLLWPTALEGLAGLNWILDPWTLISVPLFSGAALSVMVCVSAIGISVLYHGTIDPRLAARKITLFSLLGIVIATCFILIERTIAAKIASYLGLSPDFGAVLAGASVTATIAPLKNGAESLVTRSFSRFLPLDSMIGGDRLVQVIAISDLTGYTALSASDEKQALLLAALLQRLSGKLVNAHGGRIVKSMGDAVLFSFDKASSAISVLTKLHQDFGTAADAVGLTALPVHSGAHLGEVVVAHDGDVYGQTVNVAARIQGSAVPHQIVISESVAKTLKEVELLALGQRSFKNVPEEISCFEVTLANQKMLSGA